MLLPEGTFGLSLIELGAIVPTWLESPDFVHLEQQPSESFDSLGTRACVILDEKPEITYVVVALAVRSLSLFESGLSTLGQRLVMILTKRKKARLLLCVPSETTERQRKSLLALAGGLTKVEDRQSSVIVGAHFSAKPPPSGTLPLWSPTSTKGCDAGKAS